MTVARNTIVSQAEGAYHCVSRCVRRAFLCGYDPVTRRSFDHRKEWVHSRLQLLVEVFCIEVLAYALMSNHQHTLLRTRPDLLLGLTDEEVAHRWLTLYPKRQILESGLYRPCPKAVANLAANRERVAEIRRRLGSVSWFMKSLSEYIARRANKEDGCKGRFWEGRFKCQRMGDEAALLACSIYIDLNPIRAAVADRPETSKFTSAWERIRALRITRSNNETPLWLAPVRSNSKRRGYLSVSLSEYLALLDKTGREIRRGKRGRIPESLAPLLERIGIRSEHWLETSKNFGRYFVSFAGSEAKMKEAAKGQNKSWLKGLSKSRRIFL